MALFHSFRGALLQRPARRGKKKRERKKEKMHISSGLIKRIRAAVASGERRAKRGTCPPGFAKRDSGDHALGWHRAALIFCATFALWWSDRWREDPLACIKGNPEKYPPSRRPPETTLRQALNSFALTDLRKAKPLLFFFSPAHQREMNASK